MGAVFFSIAAIAASTVITVAAQRQQEKAAVQSAQFNAQVAEINAQQVEQQGAIEAEGVRRDVRRRLGKARANIGLSGLAFTGSPLDLLADSARQGELDVLLVQSETASKAFNFRAQSSLSRARASNARVAGQLAVFGTVVSGVAKAGSAFGASAGASAGDSAGDSASASGGAGTSPFSV